MIQGTNAFPTDRTAPRLGRLPLPQEHGAWVMLYVPLLIGFAAMGGRLPLRWLLLTLAVTGAFLARNAAGLLLRRRGKPGTVFWLCLYAAIMAGGALPLLLIYHAWSLLTIGLLVVALFGLHSLLLITPARKRLDRSQWGEILGVGALTLTAPAAYAVAGGTLGARAWLIWGGCALYFSSGIFYVKMWLEAAKHKRDWSEAIRRRVGNDNLLYHVLLLFVVNLVALRLPALSGALLALAFMPILLRAFWGWVKLSPQLPKLKRVGLLETAYALWFTGCFLAAIRSL